MVSVIIPVYNTEKYLRQCLDSVLAQTCCDWEAILVDDGSTDSSGAICDEYASTDKRVRVIHRANGGLSAARNSGIDVATGEWLVFVDSDDTISADHIERLVQTVSQTGADIACGGFAFDIAHLGKGSRKVTVLDSDDAICRTLHQTLSVTNSAWGKIYKSEIFVGLGFTPGRWYEDLDLFYRLYARAKRIAIVNEQMYFYRQHDASFTQKWTTRRLDVLKVMEDMQTWFTTHKPVLLTAVHDRYFAAACNMYLLLNKHDSHNPARHDLWIIIRRYRRQVLFGCGVRLKNRVGAAMAYLGPKIFSHL